MPDRATEPPQNSSAASHKRSRRAEASSATGSGANVLPLSAHNSIRIDSATLDDAGKLRDLFEPRHLPEVDAAELTAARRSAEDLAAQPRGRRATNTSSSF